MELFIGAEHLYFSKPHGLLHSPREWAGFAAGAGSPIQHHLCLWLPSLLLPSLLRACSSCHRERWEEPGAMHQHCAGCKWLSSSSEKEIEGETSSRSYVGNGLSPCVSAGTHYYFCRRTEAIHLHRTREKTATVLTMNSCWEQRKRTFHLLVSCQTASFFSTVFYMKMMGQNVPNHSRKQTIGVYSILLFIYLFSIWKEISPPPPGTSWPY